MMYPASFYFDVPSTAYVCMIVLNLFVGITTVVSTFMISLFRNDDRMIAMNEQLESIFLIFPNYNLGRGLMELTYNEFMNEYYVKVGFRNIAFFKKETARWPLLTLPVCVRRRSRVFLLCDWFFTLLEELKLPDNSPHPLYFKIYIERFLQTRDKFLNAQNEPCHRPLANPETAPPSPWGSIESW